jgi:holo-[acyl-carrier protein] synthase
VFTAAERAYCDSRGVVSAQHYAARFAAKEAALKALQTGWRGGISWQDVEVASQREWRALFDLYRTGAGGI